MLNMIACEYDTDRNAGTILTALELYNLPPPQENGAALRQWRDRVSTRPTRTQVASQMAI